jgi:hypothetical protein
LAAAKARSQQQCVALGCDGVHTVYWWSVVSLADGTAAVVIDATGPYSARTTAGTKIAGLSDGEIGALKTAAQLNAPVLPDDQ